MAPITGRLTADFSDYSREQMFALAADFERYPDFIPWCRRARIIRRAGDEVELDSHFGAGPLDAGFTTHAVLAQPQRIELSSQDGPFRHFHLVWSFAAAGQGCRVLAEYSLVLRQPLLQAFARFAVGEAAAKVLRRFHHRAETLYGGVEPG